MPPSAEQCTHRPPGVKLDLSGRRSSETVQLMTTRFDSVVRSIDQL